MEKTEDKIAEFERRLQTASELDLAQALEEYSAFLKSHKLRLLDASNLTARAQAIRKKLALEGQPEEPSSPAATGDTKKCPFCAELIRSEAIRCRFCQADLSIQTQVQLSRNVSSTETKQSLLDLLLAAVWWEPEKLLSMRFALVIVPVVVLAFILFWYFAVLPNEFSPATGTVADKGLQDSRKRMDVATLSLYTVTQARWEELVGPTYVGPWIAFAQDEGFCTVKTDAGDFAGDYTFTYTSWEKSKHTGIIRVTYQTRGTTRRISFDVEFGTWEEVPPEGMRLTRRD